MFNASPFGSLLTCYTELAQEDAFDARQSAKEMRRVARLTEKERLEELAPRADAGTRERQLEKKRELASSNKAFASAKDGGDVAEVPDSDLMGGGDDLEGFKKQKVQSERKKNERELRREEIMRARKEEQEERAREFREREERTMKGLVELARKRFG